VRWFVGIAINKNRTAEDSREISAI